MTTLSATKELRSYSPQAPGRLLGTWRDAGSRGIDRAVGRAREAWPAWRDASAHVRANVLLTAAARVEGNADELTAIVVAEVGRPVTEARGEVQRVADTLRYYAQVALDAEGELFPATKTSSWVFSRRRPRGIVAVITPWNFPLAIPIWKIAPALAFGNAVVFKPSREALACSELLLETLALGELVQLLVLDRSAEAELPAHPGIDAVSFTGSTPAGRAVVAAAAGAGTIAQAEMGGHNAALVLPDADIGRAAPSIAVAAMAFGGQKCTATKRVICVGRSAELEEALVEHVSALVVGDPEDEATVVGPVITEAARFSVLDVTRAERVRGASVLTGGKALEREGWFVEPTVLARLDPASPFLVHETFGPICAVVEVPSVQEAVRVANATAYGMVAAVYSRDISQVMAVASQLETGIVRVNEPSTGIDFNVPFAGRKQSGFGLGEQARAARDLFTASTTISLSPA